MAKTKNVTALLLVALLVGVLAGACKSHQGMANTTSAAAADPGQPCMLWVEGYATYDSLSGKRSMQITLTEPFDGTAKPFGGESAYSYRLKDRGGHVIDSGRMEDPLLKTYEYADEHGQIGRFTEQKDSAAFMLRIPLPPGAGALSLYYLSEQLTEINIHY